MAKAIEDQITYLKSSNFLRTWSERQGQACELEYVALSTSRPPPRVIHAPPTQPVPVRTEKEIAPRKRKEPQDPYLNVINAGLNVAEKISAFSAWLHSPSPPPKATPANPAPPAPKPVPPFDIQDVPKAMRKLGLPMAAKLQERWFAGAANYSQSTADLQAEIDQNGQRYMASMVDSTTIKMDWVLSFGRAKKALDDLLQNRLTRSAALKEIRLKLAPYMNRHDIVAWNVANNDFLEFHQKFQFQLIATSASWGNRIAQYLERSVAAGGVPDDLTAALGSFNFYAAVRYARFESSPSGRVAVVTDVSIYVRDPYEFSDEQYLGHWSPSHVAVVPARQLGGSWLNYPVVEGSIYDKDSVLYPVTNKDYRDWRSRHNQGGDFMIYSDRLSVKLDSPIRVML